MNNCIAHKHRSLLANTQHIEEAEIHKRIELQKRAATEVAIELSEYRDAVIERKNAIELVEFKRSLKGKTIEQLASMIRCIERLPKYQPQSAKIQAIHEQISASRNRTSINCRNGSYTHVIDELIPFNSIKNIIKGLFGANKKRYDKQSKAYSR